MSESQPIAPSCHRLLHDSDLLERTVQPVAISRLGFTYGAIPQRESGAGSHPMKDVKQPNSKICSTGSRTLVLPR